MDRSRGPPRASGASFTADGIMTVSDAPGYVDPAFGVAFAGVALVVVLYDPSPITHHLIHSYPNGQLSSCLRHTINR